MDIVNAVAPIQPITNGQTKPYLLLCDDGYQYYVKFKENPESPRVLINEFVCTKIANLVQIPLTTNKLVKINLQFVQVYGEVIKHHIGETISQGLHFGSQKVDKAYPITSSQMIEGSTNPSCLSDVLLFDHLVGNEDRVSNRGNILMDGTSKKITVLDHSHAFELGPIWDHIQLSHRLTDPIKPLDLSGYVYSKWVPYITGTDPFENFFHNMIGLTREKMWHIINEVPAEWNINTQEKQTLLEYLEYRKTNLHTVPQYLKSSLPYWTRG